MGRRLCKFTMQIGPALRLDASKIARLERSLLVSETRARMYL